MGLKENVILGHLIPAGTSFKPYLEMQVKHNVEFAEMVAEQPSEVLSDEEITRAVQQALSGQK